MELAAILFLAARVVKYIKHYKLVQPPLPRKGMFISLIFSFRSSSYSCPTELETKGQKSSKN